MEHFCRIAIDRELSLIFWDIEWRLPVGDIDRISFSMQTLYRLAKECREVSTHRSDEKHISTIWIFTWCFELHDIGEVETLDRLMGEVEIPVRTMKRESKCEVCSYIVL